MLAYFFHFESFFGVDLKNVADELFALLGNVGFFGKWVLALANELDDLGGVCTVERETTENHVIQNDTTCPYVDCGGVAFLFSRKDLRSHVFKGTGIEIGIELIRYPTDSKICNLDKHILPWLKENIFNFQVPVNNVFPMTIRHCTSNLSKVMLSLILRNNSLFPEVVQKFTPLQILHDNIDLHVFEHVAIDDFDDVGVVECLQVLYLSEDHVDVSGAGWVIY